MRERLDLIADRPPVELAELRAERDRADLDLYAELAGLPPVPSRANGRASYLLAGGCPHCWPTDYTPAIPPLEHAALHGD